MDAIIGTEIILSYKRLSYRAWYALAEFIDNSTQAYFDNEALKSDLKRAGIPLTVEIEAGSDNNGEFIRISDNSTGMSEKILKNAIIIGKPPEDITGRSRYGLGMKTAACWLGDYWTVRTKMLGDTVENNIIFDVPKIASGKTDLHHTQVTGKPVGEHYTIIEIRKLHRNIRAGRTSGKIRNYLMSMYRIDFAKYDFNLCWQGEKLVWDTKARIEERLIRRADGSFEREEFKFNIAGKEVHGWAGVYAKGSRKDAGFSIIQADRVIVGWPDSYRPETLFGPQEGGSNDLVNQRLVGELYLNSFEVSHTKDEILFENEELEELESKLLESCDRLRKVALSYRKYEAEERETNLDEYTAALNEFEKEINSAGVKDFVTTYSVPSLKLIQESNEAVKGSIMKRVKPSLKANLGEIEVFLYVVEDMSPYEPYVIIEATKSPNIVVIIINKAHPHWKYLNGTESVLNFIRHCVYDGVAEWKAYFKAGRIDPDTIKLLKDNLLRVPFDMKMD